MLNEYITFSRPNNQNSQLGILKFIHVGEEYIIYFLKLKNTITRAVKNKIFEISEICIICIKLFKNSQYNLHMRKRLFFTCFAYFLITTYFCLFDVYDQDYTISVKSILTEIVTEIS